MKDLILFMILVMRSQQKIAHTMCKISIQSPNFEQ